MATVGGLDSSVLVESAIPATLFDVCVCVCAPLLFPVLTFFEEEEEEEFIH